MCRFIAPDYLPLYAELLPLIDYLPLTNYLPCLQLLAAWKVIKQWLSAEAASRIKFVTKGNVQDYINADNLPVHMGGTVSQQVAKEGVDSRHLQLTKQ